MNEFIHVWLHCFHTRNGLSPAAIQSRLQTAGIDADLLSSLHRLSGAVIITLETLTEEVYSFIRDAQQNGAEHILVLAANEQVLAGNCAWQLLQAGASDVLAWSDLSEPQAVVAARLRRWQALDALLESPVVRESLVGESSAWKNVLRQVVEAAHFTSSPVLLMGETGTGKELMARLIHALDSQRSQHELVIVDCTTIVPDLSGSELFGHEKGAFTGAINARDGAFKIADEGTLFLDEVGELPLGLQVQLLRALQEKTYKRVGSNVWHSADFRLVCATNRDLLVEEAQGRFRRDLYYRIASWTFRLPPLRDRVEDILPIARYFMRQACPVGELPELDDSVRTYLMAREYPGNVRDLRNLVFRIMSRHVGPGPVTIGDIPADERPAGGADWRAVDFSPAVRQALTLGAGLRDLTFLVKETAIRIAVDHENGSLQRAAQRLGVTDRALQLWRAEQSTRQVDMAEVI